ncbi:MAG: DUF945 family protein [Candidatus Methanosuratincola sp.]|jgi:uncharacterized protein YdgA (DUF945 family)
MRTALAAALILLVAYLSLSYWLGAKTKEHLYLTARVLEDSGYTVKDRTYQSGILEGESSSRIGIPVIESFVIEARSKVYHGPLPVMAWLNGIYEMKPVRAVIRTELSFPTDSSVPKVLRGLPPITATTRLELSGTSYTHFYSPPASSGGAKWEGLSGTLEAERDLEAFSLSLKSPGFTMRTRKGSLALSNIAASADMKSGFQDLYYYTGNSSCAIGDILLEPKGGSLPTVSIKNAGFRVFTDIKEGNIETEVSVSAEKASIGDSLSGPFELVASTIGIDAEAYRELLVELRGLRSARDRSFTELAARLAPLIPDFLKKSPGFEIERIGFGTPNGEIKGRIKLFVDSSGLGIPQGLISLLPALSLEAGFEAPKDFFMPLLVRSAREKLEKARQKGLLEADADVDGLARETVDENLEKLISEGLILEEGGVLKTELSLKKGTLTVNGKTAPLPWKRLP